VASQPITNTSDSRTKLVSAVEVIKLAVHRIINEEHLANYALRVISSDKTLMKKLNSLLEAADQKFTKEIVDRALSQIKQEYNR
jgi:hypothetical protein